MKYNCILFDLDGTLLSTEEDLAISTNYAFEKFGYKVNATNQVIRLGIGVEIEPMLHLAHQMANVDVPDDDFLRIRDEFVKHYALHNNDHTHPFDGVVETVQKLNEMGLKTCVISNKPHQSVVDCVKNYFENVFSFAAGFLPGQPLKPDKAVFDKLSKEYGLSAETSLYIGDMKYDVMFARNVGMKVAICSFGYGTEEDRAAADFVIDSFDQLLDIVKNS